MGSGGATLHSFNSAEVEGPWFKGSQSDKSFCKRGSFLALVSHYLLSSKKVCIEKAFKGTETFFKLSCSDELRETCLPLGRKALWPFACQKNVLRA